MNNPVVDSAKLIRRNVFDAMQDAEEIGGPRGMDYIELMEAIIGEAQMRATTYAKTVHREARIVLVEIDKDAAGEPIVVLDLNLLEPVATQFGLTADQVLAVYEYHEPRP